MPNHRARRLVFAGLAALTLTGLTTSPVAADDGCGPTETWLGFTMQSCVHRSLDPSYPWEFYAYVSYDGQDRGTWSSCAMQLRLFNGADANVQVRYLDVTSCETLFAAPGRRFEFSGPTTFYPQSGHRYRSKFRIQAVLDGTSSAHEVSSDVLTPVTVGPIGALLPMPSLPSLPGMLLPAG